MFSSLPSPTPPSARAILLHIHNWQYTIEVINSSSQIIPVRILEQRLLSIVEDASRRLNSGERAVLVGVLTADERDRWAEVRMKLPTYTSYS